VFKTGGSWVYNSSSSSVIGVLAQVVLCTSHSLG
jgi:hypothetical protein